MNNIFPTKLKELRTENGLSQAKLANMIGASQKAIDFWEKGLNEPKISYLVSLSEVFKVSCDYLVGKEND